MTITQEMIKAAALAYSKGSGSIENHFKAALEAAEKVRPHLWGVLSTGLNEVWAMPDYETAVKNAWALCRDPRLERKTVNAPEIFAVPFPWRRNWDGTEEEHKASLEGQGGAKKVKEDTDAYYTRVMAERNDRLKELAGQKPPVPIDKPDCGAQEEGKALTPAKHAPLPWRFSKHYRLVYSDVIAVANCDADSMTKKDSADRNAAYIVEACNAYPTLKARVELAESYISRADYHYYKEALAKMEGGI
jgi:hypothetical protein